MFLLVVLEYFGVMKIIKIKKTIIIRTTTATAIDLLLGYLNFLFS